MEAPNPKRWLTREQAFDNLVSTCQDGTIIGLRDELVIRLGLLGMRVTEIRTLTFRNIADLPTITWMGKGRKPRTATAGQSLMAALARYSDAYATPEPTSPLICWQTGRTRSTRTLAWGRPFTSHYGIYNIVRVRAATAGLGHVAPHTLRRTAAGILHNAIADDGGHLFDLLDIQQVLGHADPATTMRSYLAPMDTDVMDRAASVLD